MAYADDTQRIELYTADTDINIHRRFGETALLEYENSSRAVFFIFVDFDVFSKLRLITGIWYRLMEFISCFRKRTDRC